MDLPRQGSRLRKALEAMPADNATLANALETHGADVARTMDDLRRRGLVHRIDGKAGRGTKAIYDLTPPARRALDQAEGAAR